VSRSDQLVEDKARSQHVTVRTSDAEEARGAFLETRDPSFGPLRGRAAYDPRQW
jgi:hypothetical protein